MSYVEEKTGWSYDMKVEREWSPNCNLFESRSDAEQHARFSKKRFGWKTRIVRVSITERRTIVTTKKKGKQ